MDINNYIIKIINEDIKKGNIPKNLIEIPSNFYNEAKEKGKLKDFYYNTCDSLNYEEKKTKILKNQQFTFHIITIKIINIMFIILCTEAGAMKQLN